MTKKQSDWKPKNKPPCKKCGGTGSAGKNAKGETIPCPACGGFGYQ